jgi:hypothetical protein
MTPAATVCPRKVLAFFESDGAMNWDDSSVIWAIPGSRRALKSVFCKNRGLYGKIMLKKQIEPERLF